MVKALRKWLGKLWLWVIPLPPEPEPPAAEVVAAPTVALPPAEAAVHPAPVPITYSKTENYGSLYFKGDILDNLEHYFEEIRRLRAFDEDAYELYSRIGAQITNGKTLLWTVLEPAWLEARPAFGATYFGDMTKQLTSEEKKIGLCPLMLVYYRKTTKIVGIEAPRKEEDAYELCLFDKSPKHGLDLTPCYIAVNQAGDVRTLRFRSRRWLKGAPIGQKWTDSVCALYGDRWKQEGLKSPHEFAQKLFALVTSATIHATAGIQILVRHDGVTARFNIDMLRTPYFFRDRDKVIGPTGRTKRIFHITRAHERWYKGRRSVVKTHFRGLRDFMWNGYSVHISVPGLHHLVAQEFDLASEVMDGDEIPKGMVRASAVADILLDERKGMRLH